MSADVGSNDKTVFVADVFNLFKSTCGSCHVEGGAGEFKVNQGDFADKVGQKVLDRIFSTDPMKSMPPLAAGGKLASQRPPGDPVLELAGYIQIGMEQGRPRDVFKIR